MLLSKRSKPGDSSKPSILKYLGWTEIPSADRKRSIPSLAYSFVLMLFFIAQSSLAAELTVGSSGEQYASIQAAIAVADPGDTIRVSPGTYELTQRLEINKPLILLGAQAGVDPRTAAGLRTPGGADESIINGLNAISTLIRIEADDVTIEGFDITGGTGDLITSSSSNAIATPTIRYNFVRDSSGDEGMQVRNSTGAIIEYNRVFNTAGDGINLAGDGVGGGVSSRDGIIRFNEVHNILSPDAAIYTYGSVSTTIEGNLVYDVINNDGIKLGDKGGSDAAREGGVIADNTVRDSAQDGISIYMSSVTVSGNEISGSASVNGALFVERAVTDVTITDNNLHDNGSSDDDRVTFAIRIGKDNNPANVNISDNVFARNEAQIFHKRSSVSNAATLVADNTFDVAETAGVSITVGVVFGDAASVSAAVAQALANETILVNDGSYGRVTIDKSVTLLSVRGAEYTSITGTGVSQGWGIRINNSIGDVRIGSIGRGFTVTAAPGDLAAIYLVGKNEAIVVEANVLNGGSGYALLTGGGIDAARIVSNTLNGNGPAAVAYGNGKTSLGVDNGSTGVDFIDNIFHGGSAAGLLLGVEADNSTISGNVFSGDSSYAMLELWSDSASISGNTFSASGSVAIQDSVSHYDIAALIASNSLDAAVVIQGRNTVYASIQAAIDDAQPGDTLQVGPGNYAGQVDIDVSDLTLVGESGAVVEIANLDTAFWVSATGVTIEGFVIDGPVDGPYTSVDWDDSAYSNSYGIQIGAGFAPTIRNNELTNLRTGISVRTDSAATIITGNLFDNTKGSILLRGDVPEITDNLIGTTGNEWDIVILASLHPNAPVELTMLPNQDELEVYGSAMMALSQSNGGMKILDRRYGSGNRSHAYIAGGVAPGPVDDFGLGNGLGNARQPYGGIQHGLTAVVSGGEVLVNAGNFDEDLAIAKKGVAVFGTTGAILTGGVTITAPEVTIDGLEITNPDGTFGIYVSEAAEVTIANNSLHDIGTNATTHVQAVYLRGATDNATVQGNTIADVGNPSSSRSTNKGVFVGDSTAAPVDGIVIRDNIISGIRASSADFAAGGRGAYGIQVNHEATGLVISGNSITDLSGFWVHGIGLEANTPDAEITGNTLHSLAATKTDPFSDEAAVFIEANPDSASMDISGNSFAADIAYGVLLHPDQETSATATHNYWGHLNGPNNGAGVTLGIGFKPWFTDTALTQLSTAPALLSITTQPVTSTLVGNAIAGPPSVRLNDVVGDPVVGVTVTVALSAGSFSAGTLAVNTSSTGFAVFSNLVASNLGTFTLSFSTEDVTAVVSNSFTIVAPEPDPVPVPVQGTSSQDVENLIDEIVIPVDDSVGIPEQALEAIGAAAQATTKLVANITETINQANNDAVIGAIGAIGNVAWVSGSAAGNTTANGNSQGAAASASSGKTALNNFSTLLTALDGKNNKIPVPTVLTTQQKESVQKASVIAVSSAVQVLIALSGNSADSKAVLQDLGKIVSSSANLGIALTTAQANSLLQATEQSTGSETDLDKQLETSIAIKPVNKALISRDTLSAELGGNVSTAELDAFLVELAASINPADVNVGGVSGGDALNDGFADALAGATGTVNFDPATGIIFFSFGGAEPAQSGAGLRVQALALQTSITARVISTNLVSSTVPDGLRLRSDGSAVITKHRIASILVPASGDPINFYADMRALGYTSTVADDGNVTIRKDGLYFSGSFDFLGVTQGGNTQPATTFTTPSGKDESDVNYRFTITYRNGTRQVIQPFIAADNFVTSVKAMGVAIAIDRNTGIIAAGGMRFRPSYFLAAADATLTDYWIENRDATGIAYRTADLNGDGIADVQVISELGVQTAYGLK